MSGDAIEEARRKLGVALFHQAAKDRLAGREHALRVQIERERETLGQLRREAQVEEAEFRRWSGKGFGPLLLFLLGRLDDRRWKEQYEALSAASRLADQNDVVEMLVRRLQRLQTELREAATGAQTVPSCREALCAALRQEDPAQVEQLIAIERAISEATTELKETEEAIAALDSALSCAERALDHLHKAGNWGAWDLAGGGLISSMVKHAQVDEAIDFTHGLDMALRRARHELQQVRISVVVPRGLQAGSPGRFLDVWFDNVFSDWRSLGRIDAFQTSIADVGKEILRVRLDLLRHIEATEHRLAAAKRELVQFTGG